MVCCKCKEPWPLRKQDPKKITTQRKYEKRCKCGSKHRKYRGLILHDMRRSMAREYRAAGVPESVIMKMAGWQTNAMFKRYDIINDKDQLEAHELREKSRQNQIAPNQPPQTSSEGAKGVQLQIGKVN